MKSIKFFLLAALLTLGSAFVAAAQDKAGTARLGKVPSPTSCPPTVQGECDRAAALLLSFYPGEAGKAFAAIAQTDPGCAMAHWGIAMNLRGPQGNPFAGAPTPQVVSDGWAAVGRAKAAGRSEEA